MAPQVPLVFQESQEQKEIQVLQVSRVLLEHQVLKVTLVSLGLEDSKAHQVHLDNQDAHWKAQKVYQEFQASRADQALQVQLVAQVLQD